MAEMKLVTYFDPYAGYDVPQLVPVESQCVWTEEEIPFVVLDNPYTGEPRDARDIESDPDGMLIVDPNQQTKPAKS